MAQSDRSIHEKKLSSDPQDGSGDSERIAKWATVFESVCHLMESRDTHFRDLFLSTHRSFIKYEQNRFLRERESLEVNVICSFF